MMFACRVLSYSPVKYIHSGGRVLCTFLLHFTDKSYIIRLKIGLHNRILWHLIKEEIVTAIRL